MSDDELNMLARRLDTITNTVESNTRMIAQIATDTRGMVDTWEAIEGAMKVVSALATVAKWGASIVAGLSAAWYAITKGWPF